MFSVEFKTNFSLLASEANKSYFKFYRSIHCAILLLSPFLGNKDTDKVESWEVIVECTERSRISIVSGHLYYVQVNFKGKGQIT